MTARANSKKINISAIPILRPKTGSTIVFTEYSEYNAISPVTSGDITIDDTNAIPGGYVAFYFNGATEPNITGGTIDLKSGYFKANQLNIYHFFYNTSGGFVLNIQNAATIEKLTTPIISASVGDSLVDLIFSLIDSNATSNLLERSLDNVNWSIVGGYNGTDLTYQDTGLVNGTLYYYRFKSLAVGYNDSNYAEVSATPISQSSIILFSDTFDGTTVDTSKWAIENQTGLTWSQNNELIASGNNDFSGISQATTKGKFVFSSIGVTRVISWIVNTNDTSPQYNQIQNDDATRTIGVQKDDDIDFIRLLSNPAGVSELTDVSINSRVKMILNGNGLVSFKYWSGSAWVQLGSNTSYTCEDDSQYHLRFGFAKINGTTSYDDVYITDTDYSTETP